jgi:hypothetical protein
MRSQLVRPNSSNPLVDWSAIGSRWVKAVFSSLAVVFLLTCVNAYASAVSLTFDTSALLGAKVQLAFDLIDGDAVANNEVVISAFSMDGVLGPSTVSGGVSGDLPGTVRISDAEFINELLQGGKLGSSLSFTVDSTNHFAGGPIPDGFSFSIIDGDGLKPLVSTSLLGDAIVAADLNGDGTFNIYQAISSSPTVGVTQHISSVAESGTFLQLALGVVAFGFLNPGSRPHGVLQFPSAYPGLLGIRRRIDAGLSGPGFRSPGAPRSTGVFVARITCRSGNQAAIERCPCALESYRVSLDAHPRWKRTQLTRSRLGGIA